MNVYNQFSQNIVNWYPFSKNASVLLLGHNIYTIAKSISKKCRKITIIDDFIKQNECNNIEVINKKIKEIEFQEKYDYILLIDVVPYLKEIFGEDINLKIFIEFLKKFLNEDGKILLTLDNKFGLRYFIGNPENVYKKKFASLLSYNNEVNKIETFTKKSIQQLFFELGFFCNFYYPLPDFRMPNVIFSDDLLPTYNTIDKYVPYTLPNSDILVNEIDLFREILKEDKEIFTFFANSFFIEATKNKCKIKYKYISFNNIRKSQYRLITRITDDYVEKEIASNDSKNHYEEIKKNINYMINNNIKTVDYIDKNIIKSKFTNNEFLLENVLNSYLEKNDLKNFYRIIDNYVNVLKKQSKKIENYYETVFSKYKVQFENDCFKEFNYMTNGLWDMTFQNCFFKDNEYIFFDQEWKEKNVPIEYILYKSIFYTISLRRYINIEEIFKHYNLTKYKRIFEDLDKKLQEKIKDTKIEREFNINREFNIDQTKQEIINLNIREKAKDKAIVNYKQEVKKLLEEKNRLLQENNELRYYMDRTLKNKFKRGIKKIMGGKNE